MPALNLYISKELTAAWHDAPPVERERIGNKLRSLLRRELGVQASPRGWYDRKNGREAQEQR